MNKKIVILLILLILFWSTVASAFKLALREFDFIQLLFVASLSSCILFLIIIIIEKKIKILFNLNKKHILYYMLIGFINPFLYYNILFKAYSILPAQEAQPLNYTWPIMLSIFSVIIFKDKLHLKNYIGLIIAFLGVFIIFTNGKLLLFRFSNLFGDFLAIGSSIVWAVFWIFNIKDKQDNAVKLFMIFLFGSIYIFIELLIVHRTLSFNIKGLLYSIYAGLFEMGITFYLWMKIILSVKNKAKITVFTYIIPFLSLIFIRFLTGEIIRFYSIVGLAFIIIGIAINSLKITK